MNAFCFGAPWGRIERHGDKLFAVASCARCGAYVEIPLQEPIRNYVDAPAAIYPEAERAIAKAAVNRLDEGKTIHRRF